METNLSKRSFLSLSLSASAILMSGCAMSRSEKVPGSFAWFDLVTKDTVAAKSFYSEMFGWRFGQPESDGYIAIRGNGADLGGLIQAEDVGEGVEFPSQWVPVVSVDDTLQATATGRANGGKEVRKPFATQAGTVATIRDPRGALLILYDGQGGFPLDEDLKVGRWYWAELLTDHPNRSKAFYSALLGFKTQKTADQTVFTSGGAVRGGLVKVSRRQIEPTWLPYVAVSDVAAAVAKSRELGGGPLAVTDDAAVLLDPTGAAIGVSLIGE